ncbi:hypothetical protein OAD66_01965 [Bacteroidia bacterium]|nr:hypothetical protein [Bacteroidia bacterium]
MKKSSQILAQYPKLAVRNFDVHGATLNQKHPTELLSIEISKPQTLHISFKDFLIPSKYTSQYGFCLDLMFANNLLN